MNATIGYIQEKSFMKLSLNLTEGFVKRSKIKDKLIREGLKKNNGILHQGPDPTHLPPLTEKKTKNDLHTGNLRVAR